LLADILPLLACFLHSQEGWRLEHETPNDKSSSIIFKGVVYNEMKGAFVSVFLFTNWLNS